MDKISYNYAEAAAATGISKDVLMRAVKKNELVATYPGARPVFKTAELERWLDSLPTERAS